MVKVRMTCPQCGAILETEFPTDLVWEYCLGCRQHRWDLYDALISDVYYSKSSPECGRSVHANN